MGGRLEGPDAGGAPQVIEAADDSVALLRQLVQTPQRDNAAFGGRAGNGVAMGELVALADDGRTPLVVDPSVPDAAACRARTVIDLHAAHIGRQVVLMFEHGDPARPIVMGVLQGEAAWPLAERPPQVEVTADGERMVVSAKEQLVLRCGKASITLTKAGKVLLEGSYVLSRSTGVNRIKGGSIQLN
ncbi:DUF6484 domain-containing protein [Methylibium rhizosphaerae]|jgi:hypothetical protein|uniref:DUF6484 domain-containing protein n=1 Tax=Methylibium rhizosphaerae TaxID=2570323 RepID=UPI001C611491|nr:DUF6484 domain-containing protein [Methylibium rhizosphaerae]